MAPYQVESKIVCQRDLDVLALQAGVLVPVGGLGLQAEGGVRVHDEGLDFQKPT